jgi:hypothetical protein
MLAKRKQILEKLPKYHKDCFAFSHMRAMLAIDQIYISAKYYDKYLLHTVDSCDIIEKHMDETKLSNICYLMAMRCKAAYQINKNSKATLRFFVQFIDDKYIRIN